MVFNYVVWGLILLAQNVSFTLVSRARNSASLRRHILASLASNGVWFVSMMFMVGPMLDSMQGKHGLLSQIGTGAFYTTITVAGSVLAHKWALASERGKSAVGANARYAQVTNEEWEAVRSACGLPQKQV